MPIRYAEPCDTCGAHYIDGSRTTCRRCLLGKQNRRRRSRRKTRCDCGKWAVAVILVQVCSPDGEVSLQRMPVCRACLKVEEETQAMLDELGIPYDPPPWLRRGLQRGSYKRPRAGV